MRKNNKIARLISFSYCDTSIKNVKFLNFEIINRFVFKCSELQEVPTWEDSTSSFLTFEPAKISNQSRRESQRNWPKSGKGSPPKKDSMPTNAKSMSGNSFTSTSLATKSTSATKKLPISSTAPSTTKSTLVTSHQVIL